MKLKIFIVLSALMLTSVSAHAADEIKADAPPEGYTGYITYIANNEATDPASLYFVDVGLPAYECFQTILGRDYAAIAQHTQETIDYAYTKFGLVASTVDQNGYPTNPNANSIVIPYRAREDVGIRAHVVAGLDGKIDVPVEGFQVEDCGDQIVCINPSGCALSGEFAGQVMPFQSGVAVGDYIILGADKNYVLSFKAAAPVEQTSLGMLFKWDIESEDFGQCIAQGIIASYMRNDGVVQHNVRNTITCSDKAGI